jgi:hypothetical protein
MNHETLEVTIDCNHNEVFDPMSFDPDLISSKLIKGGYSCLLIQGGFIEVVNDPILLFIDDGVRSLYIDYQELERLASSTSSYLHGTYLNDGVLSIATRVSDDVASIKIEYCPGLNVNELKIFHLEIPSTEYLNWWRCMMKVLALLG